MSEIESKEESIISSTRLRTCGAVDSSADTIEESLTSSNSDEYMDEEVDGSEDGSEEDESEEDESEADDEDEEMEDNASRPGLSSSTVSSSSPHNTRSKSASPKKNGTNRDTSKSTNGAKTSPKKKKEGRDPLRDDPVPSTYIPSADDGLTPDDLDYDESAYIMYHKAECGYPCLSFDIIPDGLGTGETRSNDYPQSVYLVAGTQAPKVHANKLLVMNMSNLHKMKEKKKKDQSDSDEDEDKDEGDPTEDPQLLAAQVPHDGSVNRVRVVKLGESRNRITFFLKKG